MPLVRIKQLGERVATSGLFMGHAPGDKFRRKLEPGEIIDIPDDMTVDGENLMDMLWGTGTIDMMPNSMRPTRVMDYDNRRDARYCSPSFKPRDPTQERDMHKAHAKYDALLNEQYSTPQPKGDEVETQPPPAAKRGRRRARAEASHGEAHTT